MDIDYRLAVSSCIKVWQDNKKENDEIKKSKIIELKIFEIL